MNLCYNIRKKTTKMLKFGVRFASNYRAAHKMRAWQIHSYGDINELQFSSGARVPMIRSPEEVLVEVKAVSLNPIDKMMIGNAPQFYLHSDFNI